MTWRSPQIGLSSDFGEVTTSIHRVPTAHRTDGRLSVSDLIPNIDDLRAQLPTDGTAQDAHGFVQELATALSADDVDVKIDALVDNWLEVSDDREV